MQQETIDWEKKGCGNVAEEDKEKKGKKTIQKKENN